MTALDFVRLTRHRIGLLLLSVVVGVLAAAGFSYLQPTLYEASSVGVVVAGASDSVGAAAAASSLAESKAQSYVPLARSGLVRQGIADDLAAQYPEGVRVASVTAYQVDGTSLFTIVAAAPSAEEARDVANAAMRVTADEALRLESMQADGTSSGESVVRLVPTEDASLPGAPFTPDWTRNLLVGGLAGLVAGYLIAFLLQSVDARMRTQEDVASILNSSVLGIVPRVPTKGNQPLSELPVTGPASESLRQLRTNLRFVSVDSPPRTIVITSANPSEGKSTIAANLARVLAQSGQPTLLMDADLRRPTQGTRFGLDAKTGLTQVLSGDLTLEDVLQETSTAGLWLLPAGRIPPNPSELVGSQRMRSLIDHLGQDYTVLIDAPPMLPVTDAGLLTAAADGAILVIKAGSTQKEQARQVTRLLTQVQGTLLGCVLNQVPLRALGTAMYGYGYGGYRSHYGSRTEEAAPEDRPRRGKSPRRRRAE